MPSMHVRIDACAGHPPSQWWLFYKDLVCEGRGQEVSHGTTELGLSKDPNSSAVYLSLVLSHQSLIIARSRGHYRVALGAKAGHRPDPCSFPADKNRCGKRPQRRTTPHCPTCMATWYAWPSKPPCTCCPTGTTSWPASTRQVRHHQSWS